MAVDKPTERAQEAIAGAARLAEERGNPVIEPEHLLLALLDASEGVVGPVLEGAGADLAALRAGALAALERRAQATGQAMSGPQVSAPFRNVLRRAGVTRDALLAALQKVRGSARVLSLIHI